MAKHNPKVDKLLRFESPGDFWRYIDKLPEHDRSYGDWNHYNSFSGSSGKSAFDRLKNGDQTLLPEANKIIEQMTEEGILSVGAKIWEPSVVGAYPNVANYLMGQPETMFQLTESDLVDNTAPIRIFVELVASGGIGTKQLLKRGVAILGLTLALQKLRPIELYGVCVVGDGKSYTRGGAYGHTVRIDTAPLDLDRALFILGDPAYYRELGYALGCRLAGNSAKQSYLPWAWHASGAQGSSYQSAMRQMVGMDDHDVYIPGVYLYDEPYIKDPIGWIKRELVKYTEF